MPVNDVVEAKLFCKHVNGQVAVNVRHYRIQTITGVEPTYSEMAAEISAYLGSNLRNIIADSWEFRGIQFRRVTPTINAAISDTTSAGAGALIGNCLPPQNSPHISLLSAFAPARVRGRFYVPCPTVAELTATGKLTGPYQSDLGGYAVNLVTDIDVDPAVGVRQCLLRPVILSVAHANNYGLTLGVTHPEMATQRRRSLVNRGDHSPL